MISNNQLIQLLNIEEDATHINSFPLDKKGVFSLKDLPVLEVTCCMCNSTFPTGIGSAIIYTHKIHYRCVEYSCVVQGRLYHCLDPTHKKEGQTRRALAGLICSEECYNMFLLKKGVR